MAEVREGTGKGKGGRRMRAAPEEGGVRLRKAVGREVQRRAGKFAKMLMDKALDGNMASAKLLVAMTKAEGTKTDGVVEAAEKPKRKGKSIAQQLVEGPRWEGPSSEDEDKPWLSGDPDAQFEDATDEELEALDALVRARAFDPTGAGFP